MSGRRPSRPVCSAGTQLWPLPPIPGPPSRRQLGTRSFTAAAGCRRPFERPRLVSGTALVA
eukprot:10380598-Alexandrium_andersonii.AAC.1